jgi:histone-lysine N-methyltransferase SETMAR
MLTSSVLVVLLHDNTRLHKSARTRALLEHFNWELFDHSSYSLDLAPSDHHLFTYQKNWLRSQRVNNNEEMMDGVKTWLSSQTADFFDTGIHKLIRRYDKCLISGGDYVEK